MYMKMSEKEAREYMTKRARYELGNYWDCVEFMDDCSENVRVYVSAFGSCRRECVFWKAGTIEAREIYFENVEAIEEIAEERDCSFEEAYEYYWEMHDYFNEFSLKVGEDEWKEAINSLVADYMLSHYDEASGELEIDADWEKWPQWKEEKIIF